MGFTLIPKETEGMLKEKDCGAAPLVELYVRGDVLPADYAAGNTMCGSASTFSLVFERQYTDGDSIVTCFRDSTGSREVTHTLVFSEELRAVECYSEIKNAGDRGFTLEMISSGNIGDNHGDFQLERRRRDGYRDRRAAQSGDELGDPGIQGHEDRSERFTSHKEPFPVHGSA